MIAGMIAMSRGDQAAQPRPEPDVQKTFHHDLTGERSGESGVLTGSEQRQREECARAGHAEQRRQGVCRLPGFPRHRCGPGV